MTDDGGDPRVLFVMNLALSAAFSAVVVSVMAFAGVVTFDWGLVAATAAALMVLTHIVVSR